MILGMAIIFVTAALLVLRKAKGRKISGGGIIIIGPFPIIFGSDARMVKTMVILAISLGVMFFALIFLQANVK